MTGPINNLVGLLQDRLKTDRCQEHVGGCPDEDTIYSWTIAAFRDVVAWSQSPTPDLPDALKVWRDTADRSESWRGHTVTLVGHHGNHEARTIALDVLERGTLLMLMWRCPSSLAYPDCVDGGWTAALVVGDEVCLSEWEARPHMEVLHELNSRSYSSWSEAADALAAATAQRAKYLLIATVAIENEH